MGFDLTTEEGRSEAAKEAGRNFAAYEVRSGYTEPRNWDKDGRQNAQVFSHLAVIGFKGGGTRLYSQTFVDAYRAEFTRLRHADEYPTAYHWTGWEAETDFEPGRPDTYFLTICHPDGEELAVIIHRTADGKFPLDGPVAKGKEADAQRIVDALNLK